MMRGGFSGWLGVSVTLAAVIASGVGGSANQQTPRPPEDRPPAPVLGSPPTPEDVAAWKRLWSTPGAPPPVAAEPPVQPDPPAFAPARPAPGDTIPTVLDQLFDMYAAGSHDILARELGTRAGYERVRPDVATTLERWRSTWSFDRAAFAFDLALTAFAAKWPSPGRLLVAARDFVTARADAPGVRPEQDRFEVTFHTTAVALLAALNTPRDIETYLEGIADRVATDPDQPDRGQLVAPRLLLARATAREAQTLPIALAAGERDRSLRRSWIASGGDARRRLQDVLALIDASARFPETRTEAVVRRAFVLHRLGDHQGALDTLDGVGPIDDPVVDAWRFLVAGRVLATVGRVGDAASAYEEAASLAPDAQTPLIALAALALRAGDRHRAIDWAEQARSTPEDGLDPWPAYWMGDSRFLPTWIDELREWRP